MATSDALLLFVFRARSEIQFPVPSSQFSVLSVQSDAYSPPLRKTSRGDRSQGGRTPYGMYKRQMKMGTKDDLSIFVNSRSQKVSYWKCTR